MFVDLKLKCQITIVLAFQTIAGLYIYIKEISRGKIFFIIAFNLKNLLKYIWLIFGSNYLYDICINYFV